MSQSNPGDKSRIIPNSSERLLPLDFLMPIRESNLAQEQAGTETGPDLSKAKVGATQCEVCGNEYDKPIEVVVTGISHYFDCFECAIQALAPVCKHCGVRVIGHGAEASGEFFCSAHCASQEGVSSVKDRA